MKAIRAAVAGLTCLGLSLRMDNPTVESDTSALTIITRNVPPDRIFAIQEQDRYIYEKLKQLEILNELDKLGFPFSSMTSQEPDFQRITKIDEVYLGVDPTGSIAIVSVIGLDREQNPTKESVLITSNSFGLYRDRMYAMDMLYLPVGWEYGVWTLGSQENFIQIKDFNLKTLITDGQIILTKTIVDKSEIYTWVREGEYSEMTYTEA